MEIYKTDITIIGAGVIGLAIAAEMAGPDQSLLIVEKSHSHGGGISSRNSEVIHAGIYYPQHSLKSVLCVEGNRMLYETAAGHHIPHKKTGKLIVAANQDECEQLEIMYDNGRKNGVTSLELITHKKISVMEPNIRAMAALYSPQSGIISVHHLMNYYLTEALNKKAKIVYHTEVVRIEREQNFFRILTNNDNGESFEYCSAAVINAAGLESDTVANMLGNDYKLHYCKGDYFSISGVGPKMVQRLIYPVPARNNTGLGVHLTMDLNGRFKLGPDSTYIERKEDYRVASEKADLFCQSAGKFLPFVKKEDIHPDMSGIRPKLQGPNDDFRDFIIREDVPGFINLVGIESPGITASGAIARYVRKMI